MARFSSKNLPKTTPKHYKLSEHFSKRDFVCRCGKCDSAIKISLGLLGGLEFLRSKSRARVQIVKGYQCPESAENSGKIKRNYHTMGVAADVTLEKKTLEETFLIAETIPEFLGLGLDLKHGHVHMDTRKDKARSLWVVTHAGENIPLSDENRATYLPPQLVEPVENSSEAASSAA